MNDLFERGVGRKIVNVVTAIRETSDRPFDVTKPGGPDDDAFEATVDNGWQGIPP
jgi:hypothetical protein